MLKNVDFYYFSPTGGTKKAGKVLASGIAGSVREVNLAANVTENLCSDAVIVAAPVFAGRIPAIVSERLSRLDGKGKKAITVVVYGIRAYDDALLELNDVMESRGFEVIASAALVAQHSIVPEVGTGRPDESDLDEIKQFAKRVLQVIEGGGSASFAVPGNRPYKENPKSSATPVTLSACSRCGYCASVCPTDAVTVTDRGVETDTNLCMLCMACVARCPAQARILPPALQEGLAQRLRIFKDVHRENEFYL